MPTCIYCSKSFANLKAVTNHQRRCSNAKKSVLTGLDRDSSVQEHARSSKNKSSNVNITEEIQPSADSIIPDPTHSAAAVQDGIDHSLTSSRRTRRPPAHLVDYLPSETRSTHPLRQFQEVYQREAEARGNKCRRIESPPPEPPLPSLTTVDTERDEMGLFRRYMTLPARDPDEGSTIYDVSDAPTFLVPEAEPSNPLSGFGPIAQELVEKPAASRIDFFYPFLNASYYSTKSLILAALDRLVYTVIKAPDFSQHDFDGFSALHENRRLADSDPNSSTSDDEPSLPWMASDVWKKASISIPLPRTRKSFKSENHAPSVTINFYHRDIVEVFKSVAQSMSAKKVHWQGYQQFWKPSDDEPEQRVYGELPDIVQEVYQRTFGVSASSSILTHLKRELIHGAWKIILTDEFKNIYREGIVLLCGDGICRRLYLRFFCYSADYPERTLMACIKQMGIYLCATCQIMKAQIQRLGTKLHDIIWSGKHRMDSSQHLAEIRKARKIIFQKGYAATGKAIERKLGYSFVPIENAFSSLLLSAKQNYFDLFVPDLMHEIELGVWKQIFTHLVRMLHTYGPRAITTLDSRYRLITPFGRSTIRKFHNNVSELKSFSAQNFEDLLQSAGPCFDGLFYETSRSVDQKVQDLLFALASWHASAKMRLHTDWSLDIFQGLTTDLTRQIRIFATDICPKFDTHETPKESRARLTALRRKSDSKDGGNSIAAEPAAKRRTFNHDTPKMHSIGESEHRRAKMFYSRTNKNQYERQIAQHERRDARSRAMKDSNTTEDDPLPLSDPQEHHQISQTKHLPINLLQWARDHSNDPAVKNFVPKLIDHLVLRLLPSTDVVTDTDRAKLIIRDGMIYEHKTLRINFTMYDNRRDQDIVNPHRHSDVMVLAHPDYQHHHPYGYFCVIKIFHAMVRLGNREFTRVELLWGRWYGVDHNKDEKGGFLSKRLFQIGFLDGDDVFDFIDPSQVLRAVHLIPVFDGEQTADLLGPSMARRADEDNQDYERYYVNFHVDRDMFVRFTGGGIGHQVSREATQSLKNEVDKAYSTVTPTESLKEEESDDEIVASTDEADSADDDEAIFDEDDDGKSWEEMTDGGILSSEDEFEDDLVDIGTAL
ncbi:hypothetical protein H0H92_002888 [Tricholoma furcatifolium]|nr:hypothetical protein H0H92_002888 [Tricholoma furcatifolium]